MSLAAGVLPMEWKRTNITPIFKKGKRNQPENYRPINLVSVPCKLMESIVKDSIMDHLLSNNLISRSQHGFMPGRSCVTNLLDYINQVTKALDQGFSYDVIMLDYQRAFDLVPFRKMLEKVSSHGIGGEILKWIENWTTGRQQRCVLNGEYSAWLDVTSSVVQGSVLGPILFTIYINDLDLAIDMHHGVLISKFADDSKLGKCITSDQDCLKLQNALNDLARWSENCGMRLHPGKCAVLHFGPNNPKHMYYVNGIKINECEEARDLGVLVTNNSSQTAHVENIARKAHAVLSQIKRTLTYRDSVVFAGIYKQYVRPILEFAVQAWNPAKVADVKTLERVQRRAFRLITDQGDADYDTKLNKIGMTTLEDRRQQGDQIEAFKIINDMSVLNKYDFFKFVHDRHCIDMRSHSDNLLVPEKCRLNVRKNFFSCRVVNTWNDLPYWVRFSTTVNEFKNNYDEFMKNYDEFSINGTIVL